MNLNGIDLNLLPVFEAILAEGSMTKAAERLDVGQPTVSNALNRLRKALDDPLFVRSADGMQPTPKAVLLADPICSSLAQLRSTFQKTIEFDASTHKQHFRITMSDYTSAFLIPELMTWLRKNAPGVSLTVSALRRNSAHELLKTGKLDLLITDEFAGPGVFQQRLYDESFVCLMKKNSKQGKSKLTLKRYLEQDHLLYSLDGSGPGIVDSVLAKEGKKRKIALRVAYASLIPDIVAKSDLLATIPKRLANQLANKNVISVDPPIKLQSYAVKQYWHEKFHKDPGLQWFREVLFELAPKL